MPLRLTLKEEVEWLNTYLNHKRELEKSIISEQRDPDTIEKKHLRDLEDLIRDRKRRVRLLAADIELYESLRRLGIVERDPICGGRGCPNCSMTGFIVKP